MNRIQFTKAVAKSTGFTIADTKIVVVAVFEQLAKAMANGDTVEIENFGCFKSLDRKQRVCKNNFAQVDKEKNIIPPRRVAHFTPYPTLKDFMNHETDSLYIRAIDRKRAMGIIDEKANTERDYFLDTEDEA